MFVYAAETITLTKKENTLRITGKKDCENNLDPIKTEDGRFKTRNNNTNTRRIKRRGHREINCT